MQDLERVDTKKNVTELMIISKEKEKSENELNKGGNRLVNLEIQKKDLIDLLDRIHKYKNMLIINPSPLVCTSKDKNSEKLAKKGLRKALKKERKQLVKIEV